MRIRMTPANIAEHFERVNFTWVHPGTGEDREGVTLICLWCRRPEPVDNPPEFHDCYAIPFSPDEEKL